MSKLSQKELTKLKNQIAEISKIKAALGELELNYQIKKQDLVNKAITTQNKFNDFGKEIENEYGKCTIDIETGELTPVE